MGSYLHIAPEAIILASALLALFADVLARGRRSAAAWIGVAGSLVAAAVAVVAGTGTVTLFAAQFGIDGAALVARVATLLLTAVFLTWVGGARLAKGGDRVFAALVLFSALGCLLLAGARDWVVLLLAIETATMPAYVLIGFDRSDDRSLEGAVKYFLLSMVASLLLMYGMSFIVGMSGSTAFSLTRSQGGVTGLVVSVFIVAGMLAKLSAAPFQWWAPDAYAGAPSASVAFVSSVPKIAGLLAFARIVALLAPGQTGLTAVLAGAAVASMLIGNLAAYPQHDIRRLMAYSGIAHAGYLLVGLAAGGAAGLRAAVFYAIAYAVPSMGVMLVTAAEGSRIDDIKGLSTRRPWAAWVTVLLLISLIGIPPLAGFTGKLYLFAAALGRHTLPFTLLVVFALAMSAVSAGFYFRIIRAMFFAEPTRDVPVTRASTAEIVAIAACALIVVAVGVASSPVIGAIVLSP